MSVNEIPFDTSGFAMVPIYFRIQDIPSMLPADYKVDTGANRTTINGRWLIENGYDENWIKAGKLLTGNACPTVASGHTLDDCYEIILPEICIGDWVGYNWPMLTSLAGQFKFLLGTDSLQFFNWHFDYERGFCQFDIIPGKRRVLFNQLEQSIHEIDEVKLM